MNRTNLSIDDYKSWKLIDRINRSPVSRESGHVDGMCRFSPLYTTWMVYGAPLFYVPIHSSLTPIDNVKGRYLAMEGQFIGVWFSVAKRSLRAHIRKVKNGNVTRNINIESENKFAIKESAKKEKLIYHTLYIDCCLWGKSSRERW